MSKDRMIVGPPPDDEPKTKRGLFVFLACLICVFFIGFFYFKDRYMTEEYQLAQKKPESEKTFPVTQQSTKKIADEVKTAEREVPSASPTSKKGAEVNAPSTKGVVATAQTDKAEVIKTPEIKDAQAVPVVAEETAAKAETSKTNLEPAEPMEPSGEETAEGGEPSGVINEKSSVETGTDKLTAVTETKPDIYDEIEDTRPVIEEREEAGQVTTPKRGGHFQQDATDKIDSAGQQDDNKDNLPVASRDGEVSTMVIDTKKTDVVIWVVKKGDCLWNISGDTTVLSDPFKWPLIYNANKDQIKDPDLIYPGQKFIIPEPVSKVTSQG